MSRRENRMSKQSERAELVLSLLCGPDPGMRSTAIFDWLGIPQPSGAKLLKKMEEHGLLLRGEVEARGNAKSYFWVVPLKIGAPDLPRLGGTDIPNIPIAPPVDNTGWEVVAVENHDDEDRVITIVSKKTDEVEAWKVRDKLRDLYDLALDVESIRERIYALSDDFNSLILGA